MAHQFIITKAFVQFQVLIDGVVTVRALEPFKYGEKVGQVFAKTQEVMFENHLIMLKMKVNLATEAQKFFVESGWTVRRSERSLL